jgi:CRP/FNR family nitrogen fixation transcriptional regulator
MLRRITDQTLHSNSLSELGIHSEGQAIISMNEFTYKRQTEIFGENETAEYVYQIKTGAVRSCKLLSDGRRQIGAFHLPGDIFGLVNGGEHRFTAEAIVDTTVRLIKRHSLDSFAVSDPVVAISLLTMTTSNLQHAEDHMLLLGRKTAMEKVTAFLVEMDKRMALTAVLILPMSRRDIADYLGLTIETVSRVLSRLHAAGVLSFNGTSHRQIMLLDRQRLVSFDS